jgi:mono/diheme cytochrome c family protein
MKKAFSKNKRVHSKGILFVSLSLFLGLIVFASVAQKGPWIAPKEANTIKNPIAGNEASIVAAKTLYTANCGPCHGNKGKGDGPAAQGLNPKPADHTSVAVQSQTDGAIFWKMSEGRSPMPGYKKIFTDEQRWGLVNYIRTLKKK